MAETQKEERISSEVFSQVRADIVMNMRFLDVAVFRLKLLPVRNSLDTMATDGEYLYYRPVWLLKSYRDESAVITRDYMHVLLHCIFRHLFVNTSVDHKLWNLACDMAVEAIICDWNHEEFVVNAEEGRRKVIDSLKTKVRPFTAEKLYRYFLNHRINAKWAKLFFVDDHSIWYRSEQDGTKLQRIQKSSDCDRSDRKNSKPEENADQDEGEKNDFQPKNGQNEERQQEQDASGNEQPIDSDQNELGVNLFSYQNSVEREWKDIGKHIQMDMETFSKQQGTEAGDMKQMLSELNREKCDYSDFLRKFAVMGEVMKNNDDEFDYIFYTYGLKLFGNMPLIESLEYKEVKRIREFVIAIDTSASTSGELVQHFLQKTFNILMSSESFFSKVNIHIIQCDTTIQERVKITNSEEFEAYIKRMTIKGLGGTDFRPVFRYVDKLVEQYEFSNLKGIIYFTDGEGVFPERKPSYETAFVFIQDECNNLQVPPWAIKLILQKNEI